MTLADIVALVGGRHWAYVWGACAVSALALTLEVVLLRARLRRARAACHGADTE